MGSGNLLQKTCLRQHFSLRRQLLTSFGSAAFITLTLVVLVSVISLNRSQKLVTDRSSQTMRNLIHMHMIETTISSTEMFGKLMDNYEELSQKIAEVVLDRITGYPEAGWEEDIFVPFFDIESQRSVYPLNTEPAPLDWRIVPDITDENAANVMPGREHWIDQVRHFVSYSSAAFFVQGQCDPSVTSPTWFSYYPNCTDANNNMDTGGVTNPTTTLKGLYEKSGDIALLLRPIFETSPGVATLGVYFINSGAGAYINYPGYFINGIGEPYRSVGCEYLRATNPHTGRPLATEEQIARCRPFGTLVHGRDYNPLERWWFRDIVRKSEGASWIGPYRVVGHDFALLTVGRTLFDRRTGELLGVAALDISLQDLNANLMKLKLYDHSEWAVLSYDNGSVLTDSINSMNVSNTPSGEDIKIRWSEVGILSDMNFRSIKEKYTQLFSTEWTKNSLAGAAASTVQRCSYGVTTGYPLPIPPDYYDPSYSPSYLVVQVVSDAAYSPIEELESSIDSDVLAGSIIAAVIGVFGMFIILLILWCVARALTLPLLWIELVSWRIVNHGDQRSGDALRVEDQDKLSGTVHCTPRTEITELVEEFRHMIKGFSGEGASSVAEPEANEVRNTLTWQSDFRQLYSEGEAKMKSVRSNITAQTPPTDPEDSHSSRSESPDDGGGSKIEKAGSVHHASSGSIDGSRVSRLAPNMVFPAPPKQHIGPVAARTPEDKLSGFENQKGIYKSRLFWWIVLLIVLPLIVTNFVITFIVTGLILDTVPGWVEELSTESMDLEVAALEAIVHSKAVLLQFIIHEPVSDLHWSSRLATWLLFGGATRSSSITEVSMATEECKSFAPGACPVFGRTGFQCPCDWEDATYPFNCTTGLNRSESRRLRRRFFEVQSQDSDPVTGSRKAASSFNETAYSPETTQWHNNISLLPGAQKGNLSKGFDTTYDRLRVTSAMAVVDLPAFNYHPQADCPGFTLGIYIGFQSDGSFTGFGGCSYGHTTLSHFVSSEKNMAFEVSSTLCPKGKYGFDPRCRTWYSATREGFLNSGDVFHMTAPYLYADETTVGLSAASPIVNHATGDFVGVMLIDFVPYGLSGAFSSLNSGMVAHLTTALAFVVTLEKDIYGGDIVLGTNQTKQWIPSSSIDELLPYDEKDSERRQEYERTIAREMRLGLAGVRRFSRMGSNGQVEELITVYEPVRTTILSPLDPSSMLGGVNVTQKTIYSVGISCFVMDMQRQFKDVENSLYSDLNDIALVDTVLILFFSAVFFVVACKITIHLTRPMLTLLSAVQNINSKKETQYSIPPLLGGSREVHQVYNSFSKLYKVVRISNTAFFSCNLVWANHIVSDAIQLFRKIDDRKAIGIACNNLGNIMFARILEMGKESESSLNFGFGVFGVKNYDEAVKISQYGFESAENVEQKAAFAQELADRLFNRGMYLLFVEGESDAPENAREKGLDDITKARDLDYDVKEFYIESKQLLQFSGECFTRMLRRIHGLCSHYADEEVRNIWDPSKLVEEADELLYAAWYEKNAPLFRDISRIGRLQQLEAAAIRLESNKGNHEEAARVGMRMFAEDEYLLEGPFSLAASALLHLAQTESGSSWSRKTLSSVRSDLRKMTRICRSPTLDLGKSVIFALELNERVEGDPIFPLINTKCMNLFQNHCNHEDFVGIVSYTVNGDYTLALASKADNEEQQMEALDLATKSTSERVCSALPFAMQVVLDSYVSQEMHTYILLFTDGYSWDPGPYLSIKWQIERMNRENETDIHLIILGLDVEPEHIEECRSMCNVSKSSFFVELTAENIDETFSSISSIFSTGRLYQQFLSTITMEKF